MTLKRMRYLQEFLAVLGLAGRLHLEWISSAEAQKFVQVVTDFTEKIKAMGRSPLAIFVDKIKDQAPKPSRGSVSEMMTSNSSLLFQEKRFAQHT